MSKTTKIEITLTGSGGELDRQTVEVKHTRDTAEAINLAIHDVIEPWILSAGDTITIREV